MSFQATLGAGVQHPVRACALRRRAGLSGAAVLADRPGQRRQGVVVARRGFAQWQRVGPGGHHRPAGLAGDGAGKIAERPVVLGQQRYGLLGGDGQRHRVEQRLVGSSRAGAIKWAQAPVVAHALQRGDMRAGVQPQALGQPVGPALHVGRACPGFCGALPALRHDAERPPFEQLGRKFRRARPRARRALVETPRAAPPRRAAAARQLGFLEHLHVVAAGLQRPRQRQAAQTGADDGDAAAPAAWRLRRRAHAQALDFIQRIRPPTSGSFS